MPNEKIGDHPFAHIVIHGRRVYSPRADALVREIARHGGRALIENMLLFEYNDLANPDIAKLEAVLTGIRDRPLADARGRGWQV